MTRTACHPFLLQLIASRLFESRDLAATLDQVAADEMVSNFFSVDFQTLDAEERAVLEEVAREGVAHPGRAGAGDRAARGGGGAAALRPRPDGLPGRGRTERYRVGNWFFDRWLRRVAVARPA